MIESDAERERKSILCPQPHMTLLSMLRGQHSDEPTTQTREGEERERRANMSMKDGLEKEWIKTRGRQSET